jgi:F0F1-type ATP synthase assembly protein I
MSQPSLAAKKAAAPYAVKTKRYYQTLSATSVGIELSVAVVLGLFLGMWLDKKLGIAPVMMIVWLAIGFAAGMRAVFRHVAASDKLAAESEETES